MNKIYQAATAHVSWDKKWKQELHRDRWSKPEDRVLKRLSVLDKPGEHRVLDLGCGVGRHALALARMGFQVDALDGSKTGLDEVEKAKQKHNLDINLHHGLMTHLPFANNCFDYVVSWNVIYHGDEVVLQSCIKEITRVLKPGGLFQGTLLSKRNKHYGVGDYISKNTWIRDTGSDKDHPHYYCNFAEVVKMFDAFDMWMLEDYDQRDNDWHIHLVAEKK